MKEVLIKGLGLSCLIILVYIIGFILFQINS